MFQTNFHASLVENFSYKRRGDLEPSDDLNPKSWLKKILFYEKIAKIRVNWTVKVEWTCIVTANLEPKRAKKVGRGT